MFKSVILYFAIGACLINFAVCSKKCKSVNFNDQHFRSIVFAESHGSGIGSQLFVYALLSQLRADFNFETYVSRECRDKLSKVFTETSLSDVPVFEDTFCVDNPKKLGPALLYTKDIDDLINRGEYRQGSVIWLWPHTDKLDDNSVNKKVAYGTGNPYHQGYRPDEHTHIGHQDLMNRFKLRLRRRLRYRGEIRKEVDDIFDRIARKMELKVKDVTFIGIHNRRGEEFVKWMKKYQKTNPLKKSYFYDAMEDMRESYDNVAFLYVSDNMNWGQKNIKNKYDDLFFVGNGDVANPGLDFAILARSNHSIITRGAFSSWVSNLAGGESYTEYGSIVPSEVLDKIEEETARELKRQKDQIPSGSETFNMDQDEIHTLPNFVGEEISSFGSVVESWIHQFLSFFY